ncbi:MAG TPA: inositol monophosphatase family protein, partial [Burkholderiales bacterium]|nr:inositol monophosphatase family protein [Burkholderiales bacterium]
MNNVLRGAIAAAEAEGKKLREEFFRPEGPRGRGGSAPIDTEMEERLRANLQALVPCAFGGEETGVAPAAAAGYEGWMWLVDPHDGTSDFLLGRRGSAVSIALMRNGVPVLGVVHAPLAPDRGHDTIAWAEGAPLTRNGAPIDVDLSRRSLSAGDFVWTNASSALRPQAYSTAVRPARFVAMPSIAYRLARVAAGDGAAAMTSHGVNEYDIAAGAALIGAARGVLLDAAGEPLVLKGEATRRVTGCFAGAPAAAAALARFDWKALDAEPRRDRRIEPRFPRREDEGRLARAAGCLLGQVIGDSLGAQVEFKGAAEIAREFPRGVRDLGDGGVFNTIAGQPTDDSEMALALGRSILEEGKYVSETALTAYREWLQTRPVDIGMTTERGLLGLHTSESESN